MQSVTHSVQAKGGYLLTPTTTVTLLSPHRHTALSGDVEDALTFFMLSKRGHYVLLGMSQHIKDFFSEHFNKKQSIASCIYNTRNVTLMLSPLDCHFCTFLQNFCRQEGMCLILQSGALEAQTQSILLF